MNNFTDKTLMPFGKHKGTALANVPANYLIYIYENMDISEGLKGYIKNNLDVLKSEVKRQNRFNSK